MSEANDKTAFPLSWPEGRARTPSPMRRHAPFRTSFAKARTKLIREIKLLGGTDMVFSSNIPRRTDGLPYADGKPKNGDPGLACYFTRKGKQMCFACDCYATVDDNLHAIALTVEALRGIARWGTGDMMERAFTGFMALPAPGESGASDWWRTLGVPINADADLVRESYRLLVKKHHPDLNGDPELFRRVQKAFEQFERLGT